MSASFTLVQYAKAIGPYSSLSALTVTFPNPVAYGNLIVAFLGAYPVSGNWASYPTGVTDGLGNTYSQYSQSNGYSDNIDTATFLFAATYIKGGSCTVSFNGCAHTAGGSFGDGPSIIVAEFEVPDLYEIWQVGLSPLIFGTGPTPVYLDIDQGNTSSARDASVYFRALSTNGLTGGTAASDTGIVSLELLAQGVVQADVGSAVVGLALANQFLDVVLIVGNYNYYGPSGPPYFVATHGTIITTTLEPVGGGSSNPGCSGALAVGDFPYLNGSLLAQCDNPPNGTVGTAYSHGMVADGGDPPYTWAIVGGALPPGLTLNTSTGVISGTPTAPGRFTFTVQVTDSMGVTVTFTCVIAICPASGSGSVGNYGWTG